MMKKTIVFLFVILSVQVGVGFYLLSNKEQSLSAVDNHSPWLAVDYQALDQLVIDDRTGKPLTLQRHEGVWQLPEQFNYPINLAQLNVLLDKLKASKQAWPLATTAEAVKRFKLAEDNYERKLSFYQGGQLVDTLYIGSSPGFRKVHVRKAQQTNVYAIELSAFDASSKAADWFDYDLLKLANDKINHVEVAGLTLSLQNDSWTASELTEQEQVNSPALMQWLHQLAALRFDALQSGGVLPTEGEVAVVLTVESNIIEFKLYKNNDSVIVKRSDMPYYFVMSVAQAAPLLTVERSQFASNKLVSDVQPGVSITLGDDEESVKQLQEMLNSESVELDPNR